MSESLHDYVISQLLAARGRWPSVEQGSGVSARTFSKVARGEVKYPRVGTIEKLAKYFRQQEQGSVN
jgi:transcriptional regulator with XRE-family HTH domain